MDPRPPEALELCATPCPLEGVDFVISLSFAGGVGFDATTGAPVCELTFSAFIIMFKLCVIAFSDCATFSRVDSKFDLADSFAGVQAETFAYDVCCTGIFSPTFLFASAKEHLSTTLIL